MIKLNKILKITIITLVLIISILSLNTGFDSINNKILFNGNNYIYIIIFIFYFYILKNKMLFGNKRLNIISAIFSFIVTGIYIVSFITSKYWLGGYAPTSKTFVAFILLKFLASWVLFFVITKTMYWLFEEKIAKCKQGEKEPVFFTCNIRSFFLIAAAIFVAYIPYLIDSFPGNLSYDFAVQVKQAMGYEAIINHHPYLTTKLIELYLKLGNKMGSYTTGLYLYTLTQCIVSCLMFSFSIYYMAKRKMSIKFRAITLLFYIILPIFGVYSVWLTKDIFFTIFVTLTTIGFVEMCHNKDAIKSIKYIIFMMVCMLLSMIFRKNGVYVFVIIAPICLLVNRKKWIRVIIMFCIPIILFKIIDGPVRNKLGIEDGSKLEMLSIPAQQMARIYIYDQEKLSSEEKEQIEKYINDENIAYLYDPLLSDPVKAKLNSDEIAKDKVGFGKFIIKLAFKYPKRTIESFTCTTYRFYYLNNEVARGLGRQKPQSTYVIDNMIPKDMNVPSNTNSLVLVNKIDNVVSENQMPVLSTLTGSGIYINILIIGMGYVIYKRKYVYIIGFLPVFLVLLTQLAGPVVDQRYMYSAFTCFPVLIGATMFLENKKSKEMKGE